MATFTTHMYEAPQHFRKWRVDQARLYAASFAGNVDNVDFTAPIVTVISPTPGTELGQYEPVVIDVSDMAPGIRLSLVVVRTSAAPYRLVAWDGNSFVSPYDSGSQFSVIPGGWRFSVVPNGGWSSGVTVQVDVYAVDGSGQLEGALP